MKRIILTTVALLALISVQAQGVADVLRFSQYDYSMGTARSTAMGGAFTSLGADLSSMSINPAGLGMYRSSDMGLSMTVSSNNMESQYGTSAMGENRTRFSLANFGLVINSYNSRNSLTSFNIGFAYNKLADFNTTQRFYGQTPMNSITEVFAEQLSGVPQAILDKGGYTPFDNVNVNQWGGVLAWQTGILDPATNDYDETIDGAYTPFFNLNPDAVVSNGMQNITRGYVAEYDFSLGASIEDMFYFGLTVGVQDVSYANENQYDESYSQYDEYYKLQAMMYDRYSRVVGTGVNLKLGVIIRPVDFLRIGIAYHTPTWLSLETSNVDKMSAEYVGKASQGMLDSPYLYNNITMQTPSRLLAGLSFTIPHVGIISADYERVWYRGMKMGYDDGYDYGYDYFDGVASSTNYDQTITDQVTDMFRTSDNFRVGVEFTPAKNVFLRAGYANYANAFKYDDQVSASGIPDRTSWSNISAGLGLRFGSTYLDLTYVRSIAKYNYTDIFYATYDDYDGVGVIESGVFSTKQNRDAVTLTLGARF